MKAICVLLVACSTLANDIPLLNGKTLRGEIVGTVPASIKLKTESGNIIDIPLARISPDATTGLPDAVSEPYKRIANLQATNEKLYEINEQLMETLRGIQNAMQEEVSKRSIPQTERLPVAQKPVQPRLSNLAVREVEQMLEYTKVSWKADLINPTGETLTKIIRVQFLDSKGFSIFEGSLVDDKISPGSKSIRQTELIPTVVWKQVKKYETKID